MVLSQQSNTLQKLNNLIIKCAGERINTVLPLIFAFFALICENYRIKTKEDRYFKQPVLYFYISIINTNTASV